MKRIFFFAVLFFALAPNGNAQNTLTLSGTVHSKNTGETLIGVTVYLPDLKTGAITDHSGFYKIDHLPKAVVTVQVSYLGFKTIVEQVNLLETQTKHFELVETATEMGEVVVTGVSRATELKRVPIAVSTLSQIELKQKPALNLIDAIASEPGVSQVTTGPGISKPIIRGLGSNRVVVINDGIRQEGQQWGDEHGIEIDENEVDRVEIIKGPASLIYGSDALAGVINFLPDRPLNEGELKANLMTNYQTNNGLWAGSLNVGGNKKGYNWGFRYSSKAAHSYQNNYDGYVFNSGYNENNLSGTLGLNRSWGYSHLKVSWYQLEPGIIEGERDEQSGKFVKEIATPLGVVSEELATKTDFYSYKPAIPHQEIQHLKTSLNSSLVLGKGLFTSVFGWQQNQRKEFSEVLEPTEYGLYLTLNTLNYDLRYSIINATNTEILFGLNGMYQHSKNGGNEFLIPDYQLFDVGAFVFLKKDWNHWSVSGGLRMDSRNERAQELWTNTEGERLPTYSMGAEQRFANFDTRFGGWAGSAGVTYQFDEHLFFKLNLSKGFRAPNIAELSSNGVHEGTMNYLMGSQKLKSEESLQWDSGLGFQSEHLSLDADLFVNHIDHFIYLQKLAATNGSDSLINDYDVFKYQSGNARLFGGEISLDIHPHPLDWLHFENSFSYVQSLQLNQPDSMKYLPFTPAPRFQSELRGNFSKLGNYLSNLFIKIGLEHYFAQKHIFSAYRTETATPAYALWNISTGADIKNKDRTLCSLFIAVNNLTDVAYQSHLSRLKYLDTNEVSGRQGVFNMGRNISIKLMIPLY